MTNLSSFEVLIKPEYLVQVIPLSFQQFFNPFMPSADPCDELNPLRCALTP